MFSYPIYKRSFCTLGYRFRGGDIYKSTRLPPEPHNKILCYRERIHDLYLLSPNPGNGRGCDQIEKELTVTVVYTKSPSTKREYIKYSSGKFFKKEDISKSGGSCVRFKISTSLHSQIQLWNFFSPYIWRYHNRNKVKGPTRQDGQWVHLIRDSLRSLSVRTGDTYRHGSRGHVVSGTIGGRVKRTTWLTEGRPETCVRHERTKPPKGVA